MQWIYLTCSRYKCADGGGERIEIDKKEFEASCKTGAIDLFQFYSCHMKVNISSSAIHLF